MFDKENSNEFYPKDKETVENFSKKYLYIFITFMVLFISIFLMIKKFN
jgi:hypothetical protein